MGSAFLLKHAVPTGLMAVVLALGFQPLATRPASAANAPAVKRGTVMQTLKTCKWASDNCRTAINHAWAELVFPHVEKADLGVGGPGVEGALVEEGRITGYYTLAGGPAVPSPNIDATSAVFVFERDGIVARLKSGEAWKVGSAPGLRLITENTGDIPPTANVEAFLFNRAGLHSVASLGAFDVTKTGTPRPKPQI